MNNNNQKPQAGEESADAACSAGRWIVKYTCWDDEGNTQSCGAQWFDSEPTEADLKKSAEETMAANLWARRLVQKVERQNAPCAGSATTTTEEPKA